MAVNLRRRVKLPDARLTDAILSLQPTAYWPLDDGNGPLRDLTGRWPATVTGTPLYGVAAPSPIGRGVTWPGGAVYATTSTGVPTTTTAATVLSLYRTTDASAANQVLVGRGLTYHLRLSTAHNIVFQLYQAGGASHAGINSGGGASNTGEWHLAVGTFDATTAWAYQVSASGVYFAQSSAALTGSWGSGSGFGVEIGAYATVTPMIGTQAKAAVIHGRAITAADVRYLASVAFGG